MERYKGKNDIWLILVFVFYNLLPIGIYFFTDDKEDNKSEIEETIDKDEGGLFEKIIAKMIRRHSGNSF